MVGQALWCLGHPCCCMSSQLSLGTAPGSPHSSLTGAGVPTHPASHPDSKDHLPW